MWTCQKCGREFKRNNQSHYCGKAPETVEEYISSQDEKAIEHLNTLRRIILDSCENITEKIMWSMPTYVSNGRSISFSACKNHVSLYTDGSLMEEYKEELAGYVIKKNALYLPYDKAIPQDIIKSIVKKMIFLMD